MDLAHALDERRLGTPRLRVVACTLACTAGVGAWLGEVRDLVGGSDTVVLKDVDALAEPYVVALADLLESGARCAPVVAVLEQGRYVPGAERFGAMVVRVPPLRERREDIPDLVYAALRATRHPSSRVGHRAMAALMAYPWPGNLAQLRAAVADAADAARGADVEVVHCARASAWPSSAIW